MYETAEAALDRILALVAKCPDELKSKCFEVLLTGYVQAEIARLKPAAQRKEASEEPKPTEKKVDTDNSQIPPSILPRFKTTAKRLEVSLEKLEGLFDFATDPFALHALTVPGKNKAEKTRNVALLVASRGYFATGSWSADWQEAKAQCVDQNCYDSVNHLTNLKQGKSKLFKSLESGKPIELSSGGVKEAEKLLKQLAEGA